MTNEIRRRNEIAETTIRVRCDNGHWTSVSTKLERDLTTRRIVDGQTCRCGANI